MLEEKLPSKNKVEFDSEFTPENQVNMRASKELNLKNEHEKRFYTHSE